MKRILKNSIYTVIIVAILVLVSLTYEIPKALSGEIKGNTPFEKTQSLVEYLNENQKYKDFGRVFLTDVDYQTSTWVYTAMIFRSLQEMGGDQEAQMKYFSLLREILSQTANFEFVEQIVMLVEFNDGSGFLVSADKEGVKKIREYPGQALLYIQQVPMAMAPINTDNGSQEGGGGK